MKDLASKYFPPFACAKSYKDNFVTSMNAAIMVPSVDNIAPTFVHSNEGISVLDSSIIVQPDDKKKSRSNKKQKRFVSRGESGKSAKSKSVFKTKKKEGVDVKATNPVSVGDQLLDLKKEVTI